VSARKLMHGLAGVCAHEAGHTVMAYLLGAKIVEVKAELEGGFVNHSSQPFKNSAIARAGEIGARVLGYYSPMSEGDRAIDGWSERREYVMTDEEIEAKLRENYEGLSDISSALLAKGHLTGKEVNAIMSRTHNARVGRLDEVATICFKRCKSWEKAYEMALEIIG